MSGLSRGRRTWTKRVAKIAACGLLAASASMAVAGVAVAGAGNNGDVKMGNAGQPPDNSNDPHLQCHVQLDWSGFDAKKANFILTFSGSPPTGGTVFSSGVAIGDFTGGSHA